MAVYVATAMAGSGHVRHLDHGELVIGAAPASGGCRSHVPQRGHPEDGLAECDRCPWSMLAMNCAYDALSAATRLPNGGLLGGMGVSACMDDIVAECWAVPGSRGRAALRRDARVRARAGRDHAGSVLVDDAGRDGASRTRSTT